MKSWIVCLMVVLVAVGVADAGIVVSPAPGPSKLYVDGAVAEVRALADDVGSGVLVVSGRVDNVEAGILAASSRVDNVESGILAVSGRVDDVEGLTGSWARVDTTNTFSSTQTFATARAESYWRKNITPGASTVSTQAVLTVTASSTAPVPDCRGDYYQSSESGGGNPVFYRSDGAYKIYFVLDAPAYWIVENVASPAYHWDNNTGSFGTMCEYTAGGSAANNVIVTQKDYDNRFVWIDIFPDAQALGESSITSNKMAINWSASEPQVFTQYGPDPDWLIYFSYGGFAYWLENQSTFDLYAKQADYEIPYGEYYGVGALTGVVTVSNPGGALETNTTPSTTNWVELAGPTTNLQFLVPNPAGGYLTNTFAITNGWLHAISGAE